MSIVTAPQRLTKQPGETRRYAWDFGNLLISGTSIATIGGVVVDDTTLVVSTGWAVSGTQVQTYLSAGTDGRGYRTQCTITTSVTSEILIIDGMLDVRDI